jgi:hypothetical protein
MLKILAAENMQRYVAKISKVVIKLLAKKKVIGSKEEMAMKNINNDIIIISS